MNTFLYIMIFIIGTVFGSFFTLAVYRIPLKKDITHERSFCPNCNHRLEFFDLIPILSYIFLKGKCRYCGQKIRIRYLILEVLSGLVFLFSFISLKINFPIYNLEKVIYFISFIFMYITLAITIGIDKENKNINMGVIIFGTIMQALYIVYLYMFQENINIYRYGIYILLIAILIFFKKFTKNNNYYLELLILSIYLKLCLNIKILGIILFTSVAIYLIWHFINKLIKKEKIFNLGTIIGICTVAITIITNYVITY